MKKYLPWVVVILVGVLSAWYICNQLRGDGMFSRKSRMSFFVTSVNPGTGANFGGLAGADAYCKTLAESVGAGSKTWRAYLSTTPAGSEPGVNARDRIGQGPWKNAKGEVIARSVEELHQINALTKETALDERGNRIMGRGDATNLHDILTGSEMDGTASSTKSDTTCANWTSDDKGFAIVGHHDRIGLNDSAAMKSWNSSHLTRGCSLEALKTTGGGGLIYCFAKK